MLRISTTERVYLSYQEHLVHLLKLITAYHKAGLLSGDFFILIRQSFSVIEDACHSRADSPEQHRVYFKEFRQLIDEYHKGQ